MPSPIAHIAAGYLIYRQYCRRKSITDRRLYLARTVAFSLLPDVDAAPGIISGDFERFHNGITHSLFAGFTICLTANSTISIFSGKSPKQAFGVSLLCYELHLIMDYLSKGKRGVMLFWPFSSYRWRFPLKLFYGVRWGEGVLSRKHLSTAITEVVLIGAISMLLHLVKRIFKLRA